MSTSTAAHHTFQPHCENCSLSSICLPIALDGSDLDRLDEIVRRGRPLQRGEYIYRAGDAFESVFAVRAGSVKTFRTTPEGEEQVTGFHMPGEVFGLSAISFGEHEAGAVALETSAICEIPFDKIEPLSRDVPSLQRHLFKLMSQKISDDHQLIVLLAKKTAEERITSLLLGLSSRLKRRGLVANHVHLPMSRGDIANYLGLVVETVSRVLTRLDRQGVIALSGKNVEILDAVALARMAGTTLNARAAQS